MKQIEITVRLKISMEDAIEILEKQGYKKIRESDIYDIYMTQSKNKLNKENIEKILSTCVLLRNIKTEGKEIRKITYKDKEYDNGQVISEQKVNVDCNSLEDAKKLFECLKFEKLIDVKYHVLVMEKGRNGISFSRCRKIRIIN